MLLPPPSLRQRACWPFRTCTGRRARASTSRVLPRCATALARSFSSTEYKPSAPFRVELGSTHAYCASVFKWVLSGFGLGVLIVREPLQRQLVPSVRGYNNPSPSTELQYSHVNYPGICALAATLEHVESAVGWSGVFARVESLTDMLITELETRGVPVVTPRSARAGIVSCAIPEPDRVRDTLAAREIYVESREGCLRISPHFYNTPDDIHACVDVLTELTSRRL